MRLRYRRDKEHPFHRCQSGEPVWHGLAQWYATDLGRHISNDEQQWLDHELGNLFGYHLLQIGFPDHEEILRSSRVRHHMRMQLDAPKQVSRQDNRQLCAGPEQLPFLSDTLDVVVLSHILEFSHQPHTVLREVERTLIPEGHVVILGFNPVSLWGLARLLVGWKGRVPWCGHFLTATRLRDWLALLGFDVVQQRRYGYRPPWQHPRLLQRLGFLESLGRRLWPLFGGGYLLVARKRVTTLTPIRPRWRARRRIAVNGLVKPMNQQGQHKGARFESDS